MSRRSFGRIRNRNGTFYIRYRIGGKEYEERAGTEAQAEKALSRKEAEIGLGVYVAPNVKRTTFEDLMQMVRDDYAANERKSTETLACEVKRLTATFEGQRAFAITADRLTAYVGARLAAGAAPPTIRNELGALKRGFSLAKRAGKVGTVPAFPALAAAKVRQGFFEAADVVRVRAELPTDLQPVLDFGWLTGWRKGEILGLSWRQVDFAAGVVRLEPGTTKNDEGREFPFSVLPPLRDLLVEQRERTDAAARRTGQIIASVFHREGKPIKDFFVAWESACDRAARDEKGVIVHPQLIGRLFHDLRRTAVRNLEWAGVPRSVAMKLTGHKTEAVYRRYAIVASQDLRDGVAKLAQLHRGTRGGQTANVGGSGYA
jgi:integrase